MVTLFIDDDVQLLQTIQDNATDSNLLLHVASTWDEGLALFLTLAPSLVIADYNLPGSSLGLRLLLKVRRLRPTTRVILVSGVINPDELQKVEDLGIVDRVLSKGSALNLIQDILGEIRDDSSSDGDSTDWQIFAKSYMDDLKIDESITDGLNDRLQRQIGNL